MKRMPIAIILFLIIVSLNLHSAHVIKSAYKNMNILIDDIASEDSLIFNEKVFVQIEDLSKCWHNSEKPLLIYSRRASLEAISQGLERLIPLAVLEDRPSFHAELAAIKYQLYAMRRSMTVSIGSIF